MCQNWQPIIYINCLRSQIFIRIVVKFSRSYFCHYSKNLALMNVRRREWRYDEMNILPFTHIFHRKGEVEDKHMNYNVNLKHIFVTVRPCVTSKAKHGMLILKLSYMALLDHLILSFLRKIYHLLLQSS